LASGRLTPNLILFLLKIEPSEWSSDILENILLSFMKFMYLLLVFPSFGSGFSLFLASISPNLGA
jgi:hypothetical protein